MIFPKIIIFYHEKDPYLCAKCITEVIVSEREAYILQYFLNQNFPNHALTKPIFILHKIERLPRKGVSAFKYLNLVHLIMSSVF